MKKRLTIGDIAAFIPAAYTNNMAGRIYALSDIVFKYIFGTEESTDLLTAFVNAVLKDAGFPEIQEMVIRNPFNTKTFQDAKLSIIDIRARDDNGDWYNVEVQIRSQAAFEERSLYYWAKTYSDQLTEGEEYTRLQKVVSISILSFMLFPENIPFHSCFLLMERDNPDCTLTMDCILHYLEIPKMDKELDTEILRWLYFLRHAGEEDETMKVLLEKNYNLQKANERYKYFIEDEQALLAYQARSMFLHDQATLIGEERRKAREEGLEEGRKRGLKEGLKEGKKEGLLRGIQQGQHLGEKKQSEKTAGKMLQKDYTTAEIIEITGLSLEELETIRKEQTKSS